VINLCEDTGRSSGALYHVSAQDMVQVTPPYAAGATTSPRTPSAIATAAAGGGAGGGSGAASPVGAAGSGSSPSTPSHSATVISTKKEDESQIMNALAKSKTIGRL
jgi:hypothetical protein